VEVRLCQQQSKGYGLFCKIDLILKGTRVAVFDGKPVTCVDDNGNKLCGKPTGAYIVQVDREGDKFLDCSDSPSYGELGYDLHAAHFVNSSHPLLPSPQTHPNCELVCGPGEFECSIHTLQDVQYGAELLIDYHQQLVKLKIARSCGCKECVGATNSPNWNLISGFELCICATV
jgi:hypothetical protein